jgi:hypothetical protein
MEWTSGYSMSPAKNIIIGIGIFRVSFLGNVDKSVSDMLLAGCFNKLEHNPQLTASSGLSYPHFGHFIEMKLATDFTD